MQIEKTKCLVNNVLQKKKTSKKSKRHKDALQFQLFLQGRFHCLYIYMYPVILKLCFT